MSKGDGVDSCEFLAGFDGDVVHVQVLGVERVGVVHVVVVAFEEAAVDVLAVVDVVQVLVDEFAVIDDLGLVAVLVVFVVELAFVDVDVDDVWFNLLLLEILNGFFKVFDFEKLPTADVFSFQLPRVSGAVVHKRDLGICFVICFFDVFYILKFMLWVRIIVIRRFVYGYFRVPVSGSFIHEAYT